MNDRHLPGGVSRWVFIVPGTLIGGVAGALPGGCVSYFIAAILHEGLGVPYFNGWLWLACWLWCVMAMTAVGSYLAYWIWRTDDAPAR